MTSKIKISFKNYLTEIYEKPSKLHEAYKLFRNFSQKNRILAESQLIELEPINTYKGWQELGRQVKKGSEGIYLFLPVIKKKKSETEAEGEGENKISECPSNRL